MKLISWNVNGIRAVNRNGFAQWFEAEKADIICVQETKAREDQLDSTILHPNQYNSYWHSAQKAGYSGVAIFAKKEPLHIQFGIGIDSIDSEGRVIVAQYSDFTLINAYFPNSQAFGARLNYKLAFCQEMLKYCQILRSKGQNVIVCGDFNIAHCPIDLTNPKSNEKSAGYLPQERAWMDEFISNGYVDTFRHFNKDPNHYTWWSYRSGARERNIGWRIDYFAVNSEFKDKLKEVEHRDQVKGSDHCPVVLEIKT